MVVGFQKTRSQVGKLFQPSSADVRARLGTEIVRSDRPRVTVCVPTIGRLEFLRQTLRGLEEQDYPSLETLVLDNASGPEARAFLEEYARENPEVRVLRTDERIPMFANFNRGIRAATGKYVVFFHDDDVYDPEFISRHVQLLEDHPSAVFAGGNFDVIDGKGELIYSRRLIRRTELWSGERFILDLYQRGRCALPTPGLVFRRSALEPHGFDEGVPINWGDFSILMRMAEDGDVAVLADSTFAWRQHGENFSAIPENDSVRLRCEVFESYLAEFRARHPRRAEMQARLERSLKRTWVLGMLRGWFTTGDPADAERCRTALDQSSGFGGVGQLMLAVEACGLSLPRRRRLIPLMRRVATRFKI